MSTPEIEYIVVEAPGDIAAIEVEVQSEISTIEVEVPGLRGLTGNPGIIRSATPPSDPEEFDLWLDIS